MKYLLFPGKARNRSRSSAHKNFRGHSEGGNFQQPNIPRKWFQKTKELRTTLEEIVCQEASFSKGIAKRKSTYSIDILSNKKLKSSCASPTVSLHPKAEQRKAMLYLPRINAGIQQRDQKYICRRNCNIVSS